MKKIRLIALLCSLAFSSLSYSATEPQNLSKNIREVVYHSVLLPKVIYDNQEIVMKVLQGKVVNPSSGFLGILAGGAASLLNGDITKLVKLSSDLGTHVKAITDNAFEIKKATEENFPASLVNLISTAPKQILETANNGMNYVADSVVTRSVSYKETKKRVEENKKELDKQKQSVSSIDKKENSLRRDFEQEKKNTEQKLSKQHETISKNSDSITQNKESISVNDLNIRQNRETIAVNSQNIMRNRDALTEIHQNVNKLQQQYHQLQTSIEENRALSSRGIASIAAMANIPVPALVGKTTIGAGVGRFDTKNAVAVGVSRYYENGVAVKVSLGTAGAKVTLGGGISYSF
ncbi:TPA: YadA-like family protein [Pasteurella multocida]